MKRGANKLRYCVSEYDLEDFIESYLTNIFGKPVLWTEHDPLKDFRINIESYEDGTDLPEEFEDQWE